MDIFDGSGALVEIYSLALELSRGLSSTATNLERVAKKTSPEAARFGFQQWEQRKRAAAKFSRSDQMLFLREALEQASGEICSRYHASLFPKDVLVTDITSGIGGDLLALAQRGPVQGFEVASERCEIANYNLTAVGVSGLVTLADGLGWMSSAKDQWVFADPARRMEGRRSVQPVDFQPDPIEIARLGRHQSLCVIKLTPLLEDGFLKKLADRIEFISADGECKEALAMVGHQVTGGRFAVYAKTGERLEAGGAPPKSELPEEYFFDTDPAAIRAHCLNTLCQRFGLKSLADSSGYLTGPCGVSSPWLRSYRVLREGPADLKSIRKSLESFSSSTPVLKQRSTGLDLIKMRSALKLTGVRDLTVAFYYGSSQVRHVILEPAEQNLVR